MNDFLKNLRANQKERAHGMSRGSYDSSYSHTDRRSGADRRGGSQKRTSGNLNDEVLQSIVELIPALQSLVKDLGLAIRNFNSSREQEFEIENKKLDLLEAFLPFLKNFSDLKEEPSALPGEEAEDKIFSESKPSMVRRVPKEERKKVIALIKGMRQEGATYEYIADYLEKNNIATFSNKGRWHAQTIHRLCKRS